MKKEEIMDIIYEVKNSLENDLDSNDEELNNLNEKDIGTIRTTIEWFASVIESKIEDYFIGENEV